MTRIEKTKLEQGYRAEGDRCSNCRWLTKKGWCGRGGFVTLKGAWCKLYERMGRHDGKNI
jgi:hypothetical protein